MYKTQNKIVLSLIYLLIAFSGKAQLSGNYTIGGVSPDYSTIAGAITDLENLGVSGHCTFNIRTGDYQDHLLIHNIPGAGPNATVVFQSETGNKDDVLLHHFHVNNTTSWNYTIFFDNANYVTFKDMTIRADHAPDDYSNGRRVIYITNESTHITIDNCNIQSFRSYQLGVNNQNEYAAVFIGSDISVDTTRYNEYVTIKNSTITGGFSGIFLECPQLSGNHGNHMIMENNEITEYDEIGIRFNHVKKVEISNNRLIPGASTSNSMFQYGMEFSNVHDSLLLNSNSVRGFCHGFGIKINNYQNNGVSKARLYNNVVSLTGQPGVINPTGLRFSHSDTVELVHNSILVNAPVAVDGKNIYASGDSYLIMENNNVQNINGQRCLHVEGSSQLISSDYNNWYNGGFVIANVNGVTATNLTEFNTNFGTDINSSMLNPQFMSDEFLIPMESSLFNTGNYNSAVPKDYFGTNRSVTTPDLGYYEGDPLNNDAAVIYCNLLNNNGVVCAGDSIPVYVKVINYGVSNLTNVNIKFETSDSAYFNFPWTGNLTQTSSSDSVLLGYISFNAFDSLYFKAYTELPNSSPDEFTLNDTLGFVYKVPMSGIYTVGDPADDFDSLYQAVDALKEYGVCGPVIFELDSGYYEEQISIPNIVGASTFSTITFTSATGDSTDVIIAYGSTSNSFNYVIELDGANFIKFKKLSLQPIGNPTYDRGFYLKNGASNIEFSNLELSDGNGFGFADAELIYAKSDNNLNGPNDSIFIHHCKFLSGQYYLFFAGNSGFHSNNVVVNDNEFNGAAYTFAKFDYVDNLKFNNNRLIGNISGVALDVLSCEGSGVQFLNNEISVYGAYPAVTFVISGTPSGHALIANNMFSDSLTTSAGMCVEFGNLEYVDIVNNTFNIDGFEYAVCSFQNYTDINIINNIFTSQTEGYMFNHVLPLDTGQIHIDHNIYYTHSADPFYEDLNLLDFLIASNEYTFEQWQQTFGLDSNSYQTNPMIISNTDLHVDSTYLVNGNGIPWPQINIDFDGEPRDAVSPDIGADEFVFDTTSFYDIEIIGVHYPDTTLCFSNDSIMLKITNNSVFVVDSFMVRWWLYEKIKDSAFYTSTINPGDTIVVMISEFELNGNTMYKLDFEISLPNNHIDHFFENNEFRYFYYYLEDFEINKVGEPACQTSYQLVLPDFPRYDWLWSTGSINKSIFVITPATYSVEVFHENGCSVTSDIIVE